MAVKEDTSTFKRLRNRYRLMIMNDDTYEEVITFRLTRLSVYVFICSVFVLLVGLTIALFVLTPLKFYIPGYGKRETRTELQNLKMRTDSLEQALLYKEQYLKDLKTVLNGDMPEQRDTAALKVPHTEISND
jgi:hypothetical protein